ncbi:hypothetical protein WMY93_009693 [Mugilogobius chulae]|uniref:Sulfatase N-terminal domain-containing protein n=1 Tax=Mugilogobius chulae TaxID=88201 RepID=A0AAW0PDK3_9GOBI
MVSLFKCAGFINCSDNKSMLCVRRRTVSVIVSIGPAHPETPSPPRFMFFYVTEGLSLAQLGLPGLGSEQPNQVETDPGVETFGDSSPSAPQPPHIIFIMTDDQGFNDIGYHSADIKTPTLDKLAAYGVKLENYYIQPICTPSRSQFMTGR